MATTTLPETEMEISNSRRRTDVKVVYFFGGGKADGNGKMKDVLGGKGAGLAEMTNAGLPVLRDSPSRPRLAGNTCGRTRSRRT